MNPSTTGNYSQLTRVLLSEGQGSGEAHKCRVPLLLKF